MRGGCKEEGMDGWLAYERDEFSWAMSGMRAVVLCKVLDMAYVNDVLTIHLRLSKQKALPFPSDVISYHSEYY